MNKVVILSENSHFVILLNFTKQLLSHHVIQETTKIK